MSLLTGSWLTDLVLLLVTLYTAVYVFYQRRFQHWSRKNVPHTDPVFIFGDLKQVNKTRSFGLTFADVYRKGFSQRFIGCWKFFTPTLVIRDLNLIRHVLIKDFDSFHDRGIFLDETVEPLVGHLFTLRGHKWKNMRSKLSPTFTSGKMKMMFPTMVDCGKGLTEIFNQLADNKEIVHVKEMMSRFTVDIIASCAFGVEVNCMQNPDVKFRKLGQALLQPTPIQAFRNLLFFSFPKILNFFKIGLFPQETREFFTGVVRDTMEHRERNNITRKDFLQLLMELKNKGYIEGVDPSQVMPDSDQFTISVATAQAFVFFVAGFEPASTLMQFVLYELALNQDVQQKAREEMQRVLKKHNEELTYECVQEMEYLDRVVSETLRCYPPAPIAFRQTTKDYKIPDSDVVLEKGTDIVVSIYGLHHDPEYYPNPEKFDPDRFLPEVKATRDHCAYMPFGEGPRQCIGMRFGLMQAKVGLITALRKFNFDVCDKTVVPLDFDPKTPVLSAKDGVFLRISHAAE